MDKKKRLKHTVNKAKEQSTMEKKTMNDKSNSIHDILPLDLIHIILLRVPIRHFARLRGFILLDRPPLFLVAWNPLTGFNKRISYSHVVPYKYFDFRFKYGWRLHGFGYDASQDNY
ncbi:hypothetical protein HN873_050102 [Arachis hypogaea]